MAEYYVPTDLELQDALDNNSQTGKIIRENSRLISAYYAQDFQKFIQENSLTNNIESQVRFSYAQQYLPDGSINRDFVKKINAIPKDFINKFESGNEIKPGNDFAYDSLKNTKRGQVLQNKDGFIGVTQEIDTSKLGTKSNQKFSLVDIDSTNLLLRIDSGDSIIATFTQNDNGQTYINISKEYLDKFKEENPSVNLPEANSTNSAFYSFEIDKLKLSSNLQIEEVQIKGASTEFAFMFSALGMQLKDKQNVAGKLRAPNDHFDITATTRFVEEAFKENSACELDKSDPAYSAVLISQIQLARRQYNGDFEAETQDKTKEKSEIISIKIPENNPEVELYSVPIKSGDEINYLNIKKEGGKAYAYLHITNATTKRKSPTMAKFYEIDLANLEAQNRVEKNEIYTQPSLYLGLKNARNTIKINIDLDFDQNAEVLSQLKGVLNKEFKRAQQSAIDQHSQAIGQKQIGTEEFSIYPRSTHPSANIVSFDEVAVLSRTASDSNTKNPSENIIEPQPVEVNPPNEPQPVEVNPPNEPQNPNIDNPVSDGPNDEPEHEPTEPQQEEPAQPSQKDNTKKKEKNPEEQKEKKKFPWQSILWVVGGVSALLSTVMPLAAWVAVPVMGIGLAVSLIGTEPLKTFAQAFKSGKNKTREKLGKIKDRIKDRENLPVSFKKLKKNKNKKQKALNKENKNLAKQQALLDDLIESRKILELSDTLTPEDVATLAKLEKQIKAQEAKVNSAQTKVANAMQEFEEANQLYETRNNELLEQVAESTTNNVVMKDLNKHDETIKTFENHRAEHIANTKDEKTRKQAYIPEKQAEIDELTAQIVAKEAEIKSKGNNATKADIQELEDMRESLTDKKHKLSALNSDIEAIDGKTAEYDRWIEEEKNNKQAYIDSINSLNDKETPTIEEPPQENTSSPIQENQSAKKRKVKKGYEQDFNLDDTNAIDKSEHQQEADSSNHVDLNAMFNQRKKSKTKLKGGYEESISLEDLDPNAKDITKTEETISKPLDFNQMYGDKRKTKNKNDRTK